MKPEYMPYLQQPTYETGLSQSLAYRALDRFMSAFLANFGLSLPEWKLLGSLSKHRIASPTTIARLIGVRSPIATRILKGLEQKHLLTRKRKVIDNRQVNVTISAKGTTLVAEIEGQLRPQLAAFLSDIDRTELAVFLKVTREIAGKL